MSELYKNKYRIKSARLPHFDYGSTAAYFITICTKDRKHFFGEIVNGEMQLSDIGKIAIDEWFKTLEIRPDMNLQMDDFVVMPNHIHGIIIIGENEHNQHTANSIDAMHCVSSYTNTFAPQSKNLASILRGYKSAVTVNARKTTPEFAWQPRFYDHIIRNDKSFDRIKNYIHQNPKNWKEDKFH